MPIDWPRAVLLHHGPRHLPESPCVPCWSTSTRPLPQRLTSAVIC